MRNVTSFIAVFAVVAGLVDAGRAYAQEGAPAPAPDPAPVAPAPATTTPAPEAAPVETPAPTVVIPPPKPAALPAKPAAPAKPGLVKVIVLDLKAASLSPAEASAITSLVTVALSEFSAFEVVSGADVREMMALEGEKQSLGCEESLSCIAEIAGALGARMVAFGQIEKLGTRYIMSVNLQDTKAGKSAGRIALQGDSLDAVAAAVPDAVHKVALTFLENEHLSVATTSARVEAPKLATPAPLDHGGLAWTGGILGVIGGTVLAGSYFTMLGILSNVGAPGETVQALKIPVAGPFQLASFLSTVQQSSGGSQGTSTDKTGSTTTPTNNGSSGNGQDLSGFIALSYTMGAVEALAALATVSGAAMWGGAEIADGPKLGAAGNGWRWGLVAGGLAIASGGAAFDLLSGSSTDRKVDATDFVGPGLEAAGVIAAGVGVLVNPFPAAEAGE